MDRDDAWRSFVEFARWIRSKPTWDAEERDYPLEAAGVIRRLLEAARAGDDWIGHLRRMYLPPRRRDGDRRETEEEAAGLGPVEDTAVWYALGRPYMVPRYLVSFTTRRENQQLEAWAAEENALRPALSAFLDTGLDPVARVRRLAEAVPAAAADTEGTVDPRLVVVFGSLFNFALAPDAVPFVRPRFYANLERLLGFEERDDDLTRPAHEQYERYLRFAAFVQERLSAAGVPVRDMLDLTGLVSSASRHREFWWPDPERVSPPPRPEGEGRAPRTGPYLALCAIYMNEAPYLKEWIEFHRLVGVERFFLYDNESTDDHRDVLAPYLAEGTVVVEHWPVHPGQADAYEHCVAHHGDEARWIGFLDLDEFLFSPEGRPVAEVLERYERWPAVGVNWALFGPSGHFDKPQGLVVENYVTRLDTPANLTIKSIVDPRRVVRCATVQHFVLESLGTVDENEFPIAAGQSKAVSSSKLRINHYFTKSMAEYLERAKRPPAHRAPYRARPRPDPQLVAALEREHGERDGAILPYLPDLRAALGSTESAYVVRKLPGALPDALREELNEGEADPFGVSGLGLTFAPKEHVVVAFEGSEAVATAGWLARDVRVGGKTVQAAGLGGVLVRRSRRGRGLARLVVAKSTSDAFAAGRTHGLLLCEPKNEALYARLGWEAIRERVTFTDADGTRQEAPFVAMARPLGLEPWPPGELDLAGLPF